MKKTYLLFLFACLFTQILFAQSFQKTYGGVESDGGNTIIVLEDGYLTAGFSTKDGNKDLMLLKTDFEGNVVWMKSYGGEGEEFARSAIQTNDGGFIAVGVSESLDFDGDVFVVKTDDNGNLEWTKNIGGGSEDRGFSVLQNGDGSFIVSGSTMSYGGGHFDIFINKLAENGDLIWSKVYGGFANDSAFDIQHSMDNTYIVSGVLDSTSGGIDMLLMKIDSEGEPIWIRSIGDNQETHGRSVINTSDGGFLLFGHTLACGSGGYHSIAVKLNQNGETEWSNVYNEGFAAASIELSQGGYLLMDYFRYSNINDRRNTRLTRIAADGMSIISTLYGGEGEDYAPFAPSNALQLLNEEEVIFALQTSSYGSGEDDVEIIIDDIFSPQNCTTTATLQTVINCPIDNDLANLSVSNITPNIGFVDIGDVALDFETKDVCCELLNPIAFSIDEFCDTNTGDYLVSVQLSGGYPAFDSDFSYQVTGDFQATVGFNEVFTVTFPEGDNNDGYIFNITDECSEVMIQGDPFECTKNAVTLLEFEGKIQADGNFLQWITVSESNSQFFTLSRSQDGKNFDKITVVNSMGNSQMMQTYSYLDDVPLKGLVYYQLQETNLNGWTETLATISLQRNLAEKEGLQIQRIYPVPSSQKVSIQFTLMNEGLLLLEVVDANGRLIHQEKKIAENQGINEWAIDVSDWESGMYILRLQSKSEQIVGEILVE